jgi:hypothetical protein
MIMMKFFTDFLKWARRTIICLVFLFNLEQYGRRSLIRISGIPEPVGEVDTTETVRNLISEIDPEYKPTDVIRSHKVGKISQPGSFNRKTRQIIVRLAVSCRLTFQDHTFSPWEAEVLNLSLLYVV